MKKSYEGENGNDSYSLTYNGNGKTHADATSGGMGLQNVTTRDGKKKAHVKKGVFVLLKKEKKEVNGANTRKRKEWKLQNKETLTWQVYIPWKEKP